MEKSFWQPLRLAIDWLGIALFLAIVLPWHIAATLKHKGFFWNYIIGEHFLRFLNLREPHDYYQGSIYYYLPRIIIYLFPWSFFMPLIFLRPKNLTLSKKNCCILAWCWLLLPLAFFSFSSAKANYYMIVSMPALAFILGIYLNTWFVTNHAKLFNVLVMLILFATAVVLAISFVAFLPSFPAISGCGKINFDNNCICGSCRNSCFGFYTSAISGSSFTCGFNYSNCNYSNFNFKINQRRYFCG